MSDLDPKIRILLYSSPVRGPEKLLSTSLVVESLAHDELRDLLHSVGVENPERAILEGGPVFDASMHNQIRWEIEDITILPCDCDDHWHCLPSECDGDVGPRSNRCQTCGAEPYEEIT